MATTGRFNGSAVGVYVGANKVAHGMNCSISKNAAEIAISTKDSAGWYEFLAGEKDVTIQGDGLFAFDATYGYDELYTAWAAGTSLTVKFSTEVTGDDRFTGSFKVISLEWTNGKDEASGMSFSLKLTGALTKDTVS